VGQVAAADCSHAPAGHRIQTHLGDDTGVA
jgi:hypothetical protein